MVDGSGSNGLMKGGDCCIKIGLRAGQPESLAERRPQIGQCRRPPELLGRSGVDRPG